MGIKKKKTVLAIVLLACGLGAVFGAGILLIKLYLSSFPDEESYFAEKNQVKNHSDGKVSTFGLNIAPADEMGDWVVKWIADVTDGDGFQYYVYSDPDSWDVYLYYPGEQDKIRRLNNEDVSVEFADSVLSVYVASTDGADGGADTRDGVSNAAEAAQYNGKTWLFHLSAYPRGAWPAKVELYWDKNKVLCDGVEWNY